MLPDMSLMQHLILELVEQPSDLDQFNIQQTKTKLCQFWATKIKRLIWDWVFMLQDKSILIVKVLEHGKTITIEPQFVRDYKSNFSKTK